ncbi:MAG: M1 family metallopeptidase [Reichenbachiella sp.]|uniref:M1 family metallopeptidase n=1 Tax=Reichenbachiella sp. TaxID=2184521 RepID=UPI0032639596
MYRYIAFLFEIKEYKLNGMINMKMSFVVFSILTLQAGIGFTQSSPDSAPISDESQVSGLPIYRGSESRSWDLLHTDLAVSFDWSKRYLLGKASLSLTPIFYEQDKLTLDAKGMDILTVLLEGKKVEYTYDELELQVLFENTYDRNDTLRIEIEYVAKPYERDPERSEAIEENRGLYFINANGKNPEKPMQIWTQGETEASSGWFPTIDIPNERCTQKISITVDNKFQTLSNGLLTDQVNQSDGKRTDVWVMDQPHAPYLFMMAVGEFEIVREEWNGIPLAYWMEKGYGQYAQDIFGNTPEMLTFFSDKLGYPFPWKKYDQIVVRDFVSGAMENTSASLFYEALNVTDRHLIDKNWDDIISHELMHQWFGDLVTCESWSNLTLNEGFASYSEYLWNEYKYGKDEADYTFLIEHESYFIEASEEQKNLIRYFYDNQDDMFDAHSYNKGAAVLHMLRNYVGDDAFFLGLKNYLTDNAFQSVEVAQLRMAFEKVTGEDLNWFFDQWYFFTGHPELEVRHTFENDTLTLSVAQVQSEDETPVFRLPVFIDIWKGDQNFSYPVVINEAYETYQFPMNQKPDVVIFDSERQLLAEIDHPKTDSEYYTQFIKDASLYSRVETMDSLYTFENQELVDRLLTSSFSDPYYMIRQRALEYLIDEEIKLKTYEAEVLNLIKDPSSHVRSYAIAYLGQKGFKKYRTLFDQALKDDSYLVVASTIAQFTRNDTELPVDFLNKYSQENELNIVVTLADYYVDKKEESTYLWFQNRMKGLDGNTLFFYIQAYAEKLLNAPDQYRKAAVPQFEQVARNHSNYMARFSAFQALVLMSDLQGVDRLIREIRDKEKDPRLTSLYNRI